MKAVSMTPATNTNLGKRPMNIRMKKRMNAMSLFLLLAPAIVLLFIFHYIPLYGIIIAFEDFSPYLGFLKSPWVAFKHFEYFLTDSKFWEVMVNTIVLNIYDIAFGFSAPILFALLANEMARPFYKKLVQTISYLPHFLSWIVVSGMFYQILSPTSGMVNLVLTNLFGIEPIYFMAEIQLFRGIAVFADIWKGVGWSAILYFSVIAGIDTQLYDAAMIDGAGRIKQIIHITLPGMVPMIVLLFLLRLSGLFSIGFERLFMLSNPLVLPVSDVISTYVYRVGLEEAQYSLTTAIGLVQSLIGFTLLVSSNKLSKKIVGMGLY